MQLNVHELVALRTLLELIEYTELDNLDGTLVLEKIVKEAEEQL